MGGGVEGMKEEKNGGNGKEKKIIYFFQNKN